MGKLKFDLHREAAPLQRYILNENIEHWNSRPYKKKNPGSQTPQRAQNSSR